MEEPGHAGLQVRMALTQDDSVEGRPRLWQRPSKHTCLPAAGLRGAGLGFPCFSSDLPSLLLASAHTPSLGGVTSPPSGDADGDADEAADANQSLFSLVMGGLLS